MTDLSDFRRIVHEPMVHALREKNRELRVSMQATETREKELSRTLGRAAHIARNLMGMISVEAWRATGGDDGQGHYEGDYHAENIAQEIREWAILANGPTCVVCGNPIEPAPRYFNDDGKPRHMLCDENAEYAQADNKQEWNPDHPSYDEMGK